MRIRELYNKLSLNELAEKYKKHHDEEAFRIIYFRIVRFVFNNYRHDASYDEINDFLFYFNEKLPALIEGYNPEKSQFQTYIFNAVKKDYINYMALLRRKKRKPANAYFVDYEDEEIIYSQEREETLMKFVDALDVISILGKRQKEIFLMKYLYGYTNKEIAQELRLSLHTVNSTLSKAHKKIRQVLRQAQ